MLRAKLIYLPYLHNLAFDVIMLSWFKTNSTEQEHHSPW